MKLMRNMNDRLLDATTMTNGSFIRQPIPAITIITHDMVGSAQTAADAAALASG